MKIETIKLFAAIGFDRHTGATDPKPVAALNLEVAVYGYSLAPDLIAAITSLSPDDFRRVRTDLLALLAKLSGADSEHTPLFKDFPYATPDQFDYLLRRIVGFIQNRYGLTADAVTTLSCGHVIDHALFDIERFGACPICQFGVDELSSPGDARYHFASATPLRLLSWFSDEAAHLAADRLISRPSSLSADEQTFLRDMIARGFRPAIPDKPYRETVPFLYAALGADRTRSLIVSATDCLRIACYLSDTAADLSLKDPVRFRISTHHKKALLGLLEGLGDPTEDMLRHRERWLRLGERLNPGSAANRRRYPATACAFDRLRNQPRAIETFSRRVERDIRQRPLAAHGVELLATRPGEFARRIDLMIRAGADVVLVREKFLAVLPSLPTRRLFELVKYLESRSRFRQRIFFPKGNVNRVQVIDDVRPGLPDGEVAMLLADLRTEIGRRLAALPPLGRVHVDTWFKGIVVPFNRRGDSSTSSPVGKGSRQPFGGEIVRLFVHWTGNIDVDLSIILFDEHLAHRGHVAFTNLEFPGCVHSGDVQNAPHGASEFIDFNVQQLLGDGIRYVAASIISYRGQYFRTFPCFCGFMERDALASGAIYEPKAVRLKFDLDAPNTAHMPLIFDLKERHVIFVDMASGGSAGGAVKGQSDKFRRLTEAMLSLDQRKPTYYDIAQAHIAARGSAASADEAEVSYGADALDRLVADFVDTL